MRIACIVELLWVSFIGSILAYSELIEEWTCHDDDFRLQCNPLMTQIIILEATFTPNKTCNPWNTSESSGPTKSFRRIINQRCSGRNTCNFKVAEDVPGANKWGPGSVYLRYVCLDEIQVLKTCTANLNVNGEGFIQTPGYPRFYVGGRKCHWTLKTRPHRQIQVKFLDISLREQAPLETHCLDFVLVTEHGLNLLSTCNDTCQHLCEPITIVSAGSEINITLVTSSTNIFPKRGILLHYKTIGCVLPSLGRGAFFVAQQEDRILFSCPEGSFFEDSKQRERVVSCEETPIKSLPDCIIPDNRFFWKNIAMEDDLWAPSIIMGLLFILNSIIVGIIFKYKKKLQHVQDPWESQTNEELKEI